MNVFVRISVFAVVFTIFLIVGCSDRGTSVPEPVSIEKGGPLIMTHVYSPELDVQIGNPYALLQAVAYAPKISWEVIYGGEGKPVPLLILLPPQGKDHYFYFNHGLQQIADELIATGEIQPMLIACVSNDLVFGGYLFAGHYPGAGDWDGMIGQSLLTYIETFGITINDPAKRGIGGVGQGAYGAFRAAMLNPGTFTSISAIDGPLDFDGADGNSGLIDLFAPVLNEQGLLGSDTWKEDFSDSPDWPTTGLFIGGSLAFSPHDTAVTYTGTGTKEITSRLSIDDTTTLVTGVVGGGAEYDFHFHVPFDNNGYPYAPIWENFWLPNNLENLPSASLDGVNIWVATSDEASFGYHEQTMSFISTLQGWGYPVTTRHYSGYTGNPATDDQYVYDLLKEMLIFHSQSFGNGD